MLTARCYRVRPEGLARLKTWLATLSARRAEATATLLTEGVRWERVFLLDHPTGTLLIALSDSDDPARARCVHAASTEPVDIEHRSVLAEVLGESFPIALELELVAGGES